MSKVNRPDRLSIRLPQSERYGKVAKRLAELGTRARSDWVRKALLLMVEEEQHPLRQKIDDALTEWQKSQRELLEKVKEISQGCQKSDDNASRSATAQGRASRVNVGKLKRMVEGGKE